MLQLVHPGEFILADIQPRSCSKMYRHPACVQIFVNPVHSNNVEATFDFVEATFDFFERIVRLVAFDNVASTLLLVWTGL